MNVILPVILIVRLALYPHYPPIEVGRFETESQCRAEAARLDQSTPVLLILTCEVET